MVSGDIKAFLEHWQELMGALIGAAFPIGFWFFTKWRENTVKNKDNLLYLAKIIVVNINNVLDIETTIESFLSTKVKILEENVSRRKGTNTYSIDAAFFPTFVTKPVDENYLNISSRSGYLDNKLLQVSTMSKNFSHAIEDFKHQFQYTLSINKELALIKASHPDVQIEMLLSGLKEFRAAVERDVLGNNINIFLKLLVTSHITLKEIQQRGIWLWRFKFSPSFVYFKNYKEYKEFVKSGFERVDAYIQPKVQSQLEEFQAQERKT